MCIRDSFAIGKELPFGFSPYRVVLRVIGISIDVNNTRVMFMTYFLLVIVTKDIIVLNIKY